MTRRNSLRRVSLLTVGAIAVLAGKAFSATLTNPAPIVIPGPGSSNGSASVYPSVISVGGLGLINSLNSISVEINEFSNTDPSNVRLALVGPTGAALVIQGDSLGSTGATNLHIAYSDAAASLLPQNTLLFSGTFKPTQYASIGSFPSPGPGAAYNSPAPFGTSTFSATFGGTDPNGTWSLYAFDPVSGDSGGISGGWSLTVNAVPLPEPSTFVLGIAGLAGLGLVFPRKKFRRA